VAAGTPQPMIQWSLDGKSLVSSKRERKKSLGTCDFDLEPF